MRRTCSLLLLLGAASCADPTTADTSFALDDEIAVVEPTVTTPSLHAYDGMPDKPDADDPAIWVPAHGDHPPLVIGTLKNGGLHVYDLAGRLVQSFAVAEPCGRYNNVAIAYRFPLRRPSGAIRRTDVAVVTDRGCDHLRFFAIDPDATGGPLVDVTAAAVPRVFPTRYVQPSPVQSPGEPVRLEDNPVEDQSTAYGLAVYARDPYRFRAAITQRSRSVVGLVELHATADGRITYRARAELRFDPRFRVRTAGGDAIDWTPCREDAADDPQFEGLVYDEDREVLWAAQEVVGLWKIPLDVEPWGVVYVRARRLVEPVRAFGAPYWAIPDDDEFECAGEAPSPLPEGTIAAPGTAGAGGAYLDADVEGVALVRDPDDGEPEQLLVSSQGTDTFHLFDLDDGDHEGAFHIAGVSETDGHEVVTSPVGDAFPDGLLVVQNGDAPPPASTDPVDGHEYDGSTQFVLVDWADVLDAL